jgi:hypothetical protein
MTSNLRRPELSVVVASHNRPLRLRSLLNALGRQTLERSLWEVIVCHDSGGGETERVLAGHPLAADETLRYTRLVPGWAINDLAEIVALARGSARHRAILL